MAGKTNQTRATPTDVNTQELNELIPALASSPILQAAAKAVATSLNRGVADLSKFDLKKLRTEANKIDSLANPLKLCMFAVIRNIEAAQPPKQEWTDRYEVKGQGDFSRNPAQTEQPFGKFNLGKFVFAQDSKIDRDGKQVSSTTILIAEIEYDRSLPSSDHLKLRTLYQNPEDFEGKHPKAYPTAKKRVDKVAEEVAKSHGLKGGLVVIADIDRGISSNGKKSFLNYLRGVSANSAKELQTGLPSILEAIGKDINPKYLSKVASVNDGGKRVRR